VSQGAFPQTQAWQTLNAMLTAGLSGVDVAAVSEKDFNEGELIMTPPSVRTYYGGTKFTSFSDMSRQNYQATGEFIILCADEDRSPDLAQQAFISVALAGTVCALLAGATLILPSGDQSEPITLISITPLPVEGVGMAYAIAVEVPGLAQFPGTNVAGYTGEVGE
jgi:hypothetical protein